MRLQGGVDELGWQLRPGEASRWALWVDRERIVLEGTGSVAVRPGADVAIERCGADPAVFAVSGNFPNPFNPSTTIAYRLPQAAAVELRILDLAGQQVRGLDPGPQAAGRHEAMWDGRDDSGRQVASGVYLFEVQAPPFHAVRRMLLLR